MAFDPTAAYGRIDPIALTAPTVAAPAKRPRSPSPPPRPSTPEPLDVLPDSMRHLAAMLGSAPLGSTTLEGPPPLPPSLPPLLLPLDYEERDAAVVDSTPNEHAGLFREEGGVKEWMRRRRRAAPCTIAPP